MSRLNSLQVTVFAVILFEICTGCAPLKMPKTNLWPFTAEDPPEKPSRIIAAWSDTILYQSDQIPMRGFGGRLLFYTNNKPEPVKVDGTLTVYVFDETNRDPNNLRPDRKYIFTKEQLQTHYSKSKLGHSYSVWIPWDETGGPQKDMSLIVRFTPEKGDIVVSEQAKQILPGKINLVQNNSGSAASQSAVPGTSVQSPAMPGGSVQPASYVMPLPPVGSGMQGCEQNGVDQSYQMNTTTIKLPSQNSLNKLSVTGYDAANSPMRNIVMPPQATVVNPPIHTGEANMAVPNMEQSQTTRFPGATYANPGFTSSNQGPQSFAQPSHFALGRPRAPFEPISQPNLGRAPMQPSPSGQVYYPETTPQPTTSVGYPTTSVNSGTVQN